MRKKITIDVEMEERWLTYFISMLEHMEYYGSIGGSRMIGFHCDGDGDFRPKFNFNTEIDTSKVPIMWYRFKNVDLVYDAG
jgi:hypothetical protein